LTQFFDDTLFQIQQTAIVEPLHPSQCCAPCVIKPTPRAVFVSNLSLIKAIDSFCQRVIVGIADTANTLFLPQNAISNATSALAASISN
tara:strand:+ start:11988 stop:12254 length:267 start_codon:yes stop_codon:yes gene_type:complete